MAARSKLVPTCVAVISPSILSRARAREIREPATLCHSLAAKTTPLRASTIVRRRRRLLRASADAHLSRSGLIGECRVRGALLCSALGEFLTCFGHAVIMQKWFSVYIGYSPEAVRASFDRSVKYFVSVFFFRVRARAFVETSCDFARFVGVHLCYCFVAAIVRGVLCAGR